MVRTLKYREFVPPTTTFRYFPPNNKLNIYRQILELFPMEFVVYCFAYGANVVPMDRITPTHNAIIDIVFVVDDTAGFHEINLKRNPDHYSGLKFFGIATIESAQENYGGAVYVNKVPFKNVTLRYGVIYASHFTRDLQTWNTMYIAGRMLQPIVTLKLTYNSDILDALEDNLVMAVHTALLLLPEKFTERELYETIVRLSYEGDFRLSLKRAETISKTTVESQFQHFHNIYTSIMLAVIKQKPKILKLTQDNITWVQSTRNRTIFYHLTEMASAPIICLYKGYVKKNGEANAVEAISNISLYPRERRTKLIRKCISKVVRKSSFVQCVKNVFTGGIIRSLYYGALKFANKTKSRFFSCKNVSTP